MHEVGMHAHSYKKFHPAHGWEYKHVTVEINVIKLDTFWYATDILLIQW